MTGSARFVLVYHRQPFEEYEESGEVRLRPHRSPNGIIPSLKGFCASLPDPSEAVWLAWSHVDTAEQAGSILGEATVEAQKETPLRVVRMGLTREQVSSFYHVTSKAALWPILHGFPGRFDYDAADWEAFREVNALFAKAVCATAAPGATVWVHDYNLWLVPGLVKAQRRDL
ncbi:MAG: trehalose-6-phosphate synthase, partial [Burkholderiaceae bacterium]